MMGKTKTAFKLFTIAQYKQEEQYLSSMHKKGWRLINVTFPGFYHFEQCEPENVTYRLDYNQEGIANKPEYVQMFSDCGWEYLFDFVGYSYFRKAGDEPMEEEEIFCDDESRLDMMKRVYKGRIIPLIVIFACIIFPQFVINTIGNGRGNIVQNVLSMVLFLLGILYIFIFGVFTVHFYQYEKSIYPGDKKGKMKYYVIFVLLIAAAFIMGTVKYLSYTSDYTIHDYADGFMIEADRLNKSIVEEYDLKKGDVIEV